MTHFGAGERTDFAADNWQHAKQRHLGTGSICRVQTLAQCQRVPKAVRRTCPPPAERVQESCQESCCVIELLFDSFTQPARAGMRSSGMSIRQMLYRVESYQIDLQLEAHPERNLLVVTGQLLDVSQPEVVAHDVQVTLSDGGESVVKTMTNELGEFRGEVENSGDLDLSFLVRGGKPFVIFLRSALGIQPSSR